MCMLFSEYIHNSCSLLSVSVYDQHSYIEIVGRLAEQSMKSAVSEVKALPDYPAKGEVINLLQHGAERVLIHILIS